MKAKEIEPVCDGEDYGSNKTMTDMTRAKIPRSELNAYILYMRDIGGYPVLSFEEQKEQFIKYYDSRDEETRNLLIVSNLRLVVVIASQFGSHYLQPSDIIQEGNCGLIKAVEKFNPYKGILFSTYATYWIRCYILRHIFRSWSIVMGMTVGEKKIFFSLNKITNKLISNGILPTAANIAEDAQVSEEDVEKIINRFANPDVSLNCFLGDGQGDSLLDFISGNTDIESEIINWIDGKRVKKLIKEYRKTLDQKNRYVFDHRVFCEESLALEDIGEKFHVTREAIRLYEVKLTKNCLGYIRKRLRKQFVKDA